MIDQELPQVEKNRDVSTTVSIAVGLGVVILLAFAFLSPNTDRPQQGQPAPDFSLEPFDGSEVSLNDLRGQVVVLNFWASWCESCRLEAPDLQRVWEMYGSKGVVFLGVSYKDAKKASRAFIKEFGITYRSGSDPKGRISRAYAVTGVPETFIIDRDGKVTWVRIGEVRADELIQQLEQLPDK